MYQNMSFHNKVDASYNKQFFSIFQYILLKSDLSLMRFETEMMFVSMFYIH